MSVNDAWVMHAWGEAVGAQEISLVADGSARYTDALGLTLDLQDAGLGLRCKRFSMVVEDGVIQSVNIDEGAIDLTSAEKTCAL